MAVAEAGRAARPAITAREAEVLDAVCEHLTNAGISDRLVISVRTVESHVTSMLRKAGAQNRRDLIAWAHATGRAPATGRASRSRAPLPAFYVAGTTGVDVATGTWAGPTAEAQTRRRC